MAKHHRRKLALGSWRNRHFFFLDLALLPAAAVHAPMRVRRVVVTGPAAVRWTIPGRHLPGAALLERLDL